MDTSKILDLIKQNGPALPIEIASSLGVDSFLAKAYLDELASTGQLKTSSRVGESFIYFVDGQEGEANQKAETLLTQTEKRLKTFAKSKMEETPELAKKRAHFAKHFEKAITEEPEKPVVAEQRVTAGELDSVVSDPEPQHIDLPKQPLAFVREMFKRAVPQKASFLDIAMNFLSKNAEIDGELARKKNEASLLARVPSSVGSVTFFVKVKNKKRITEADLSLAYTEGLKHNAPTLFVTNGKLSKTAQEYADELKGLLKVRILD